jgi:hypothetical protein
LKKANKKSEQSNDEPRDTASSGVDDFATTQTAYKSWHKHGYNIIRVPLCRTKKGNGEEYDGRTPEGT